MARKIVWTLSAVRTKDKILLYWLERNQSAGYPKKLDKLFYQAARLISRHPLIGRKTTYPDVRSKLVRDYIVFYKFSDKQIEDTSYLGRATEPERQPFYRPYHPGIIPSPFFSSKSL